jgi:hypothetical protein
MQLENMKRNINWESGGERRGGLAAGRSRLASAVGRTVSSAAGRWWFLFARRVLPVGSGGG